MSYFDNGEEFGGDSDENMDEAIYWGRGNNMARPSGEMASTSDLHLRVWAETETETSASARHGDGGGRETLSKPFFDTCIHNKLLDEVVEIRDPVNSSFSGQRP